MPTRDLPKPLSPALEAAALALAQGDLAAARSGFETLVNDTSAPPIVRALAYSGLSEIAIASNDLTSAESIWKRQAGDAALSRWHRQVAERKRVEADREKQGQPARRTGEFREQLPNLPSASTVFYVAPNGSDTQDGSASRPFATLERARDSIRALRKTRAGRLPIGGVRLQLEAGDYAIRQTFKLTAEDSGTADAPIVYQARPGASVRFRGGERITNWRSISDSAIKSHLSPAIANAVLEADLTRLGSRDWGDPTVLRKRPELFVQGVPQTLARWPDTGFVKTGEVLGTNTFKVWDSIPGCKDGRFRFVEDRPRTWLDEPDVRLYGYWFWDWYEEYQKVAAIDATHRAFTLAEPFSNYGYRKDQRYYAVNVFRELDQPGEWYLDRRSARLYWLPSIPVPPSQVEVVLSMFDAPLIAMDDVQHVILQGLIFEEGRGDAILVSGGADCLIAGCLVRRFGGDGIVITGGRHHGVFGCWIETMGCGGTRVQGGDRSTLEPGRHFVENCTIRDISRIKRTYTPAVHLDGCGHRIAHNRFENMPSSAMRIEGNEHWIELNEVRDVVKESDDQGGVDMFGNPLYRGVVFRWNRWSDIRGGTHNGAAGVRLDDMISGVVVHGNVFERCGAVIFGGVQIHGGKENLVDNNVFLDCFAGVSFSRWGEKRWLDSIARFLHQAAESTYVQRYPELAALKSGADVNDISRNLFTRSGPAFLRDGGIARAALNAVVTETIDPAAVADSASIRARAVLRRALFEPIPISEIGPYDHPWRVTEVKTP